MILTRPEGDFYQKVPVLLVRPNYDDDADANDDDDKDDDNDESAGAAVKTSHQFVIKKPDDDDHWSLTKSTICKLINKMLISQSC